MAKVKIPSNAFVYPMPMVLIGSVHQNQPNFMAAAWVARLNYQPPMIGFASGKSHHTNTAIQTSKVFSINIPGADLMEKVDYCGLVSGKKHDKSTMFELFYGVSADAPMVAECPLCMECRLSSTVDLPTNTLFIGEIYAAYCEEKALTDGKPDLKKMSPFTLTMPDNNFWGVGKLLGKAWTIGKKFQS